MRPVHRSGRARVALTLVGICFLAPLAAALVLFVRGNVGLERLSVLADGRVAYRLRNPRRNGATHLVMTPVHVLARWAFLVPPSRFPLLRLAGVLAPNAPWRAAVVPGDGHAGADGTRASPSAVHRKAGKSKGATPSPLLAEHDRPKDVAASAVPAPRRPDA